MNVVTKSALRLLALTIKSELKCDSFNLQIDFVNDIVRINEANIDPRPLLSKKEMILGMLKSDCEGNDAQALTCIDDGENMSMKVYYLSNNERKSKTL